jgi:Flp pilus assembly protein TadG
VKRLRQRGQSLVEFALVLPVLLIILMGLFDFGRAILAYNTVAEAARNGARVAIVNQIPADICSVAANRAIAISLPTTCAANATAVGVYVTASTGGSSCTVVNACTQTVKATYQFTALTPIISRIIGPITMSSSSTVTVESICSTAPCPQT